MQGVTWGFLYRGPQEETTLFNSSLHHGLAEVALAASLEVQPEHLFQMQDKHKTTAAMEKNQLGNN